MKKQIILVLVLILILPCLGLANAFSFRLGYFIPRAQSDLWAIEFENMNFTLSNFQNSTIGFGYERYLTREISVVLSFETYNKNKAGFYKDFVGYSFEEGDFAFPKKYYKGDFSISHSFGVSITPVQASVKLMPLGRRGSFIPYIGGGAGLYLWNVKILGLTIDFSDAWIYEDPKLGDVEIYTVNESLLRENNRFSVGYHIFGGVMFPVGKRMAFEAEFKFNHVKGNFRDAFEGFEPFDLRGYQVSVGLNYWF